MDGCLHEGCPSVCPVQLSVLLAWLLGWFTWGRQRLAAITTASVATPSTQPVLVPSYEEEREGLFFSIYKRGAVPKNPPDGTGRQVRQGSLWSRLEFTIHHNKPKKDCSPRTMNRAMGRSMPSVLRSGASDVMRASTWCFFCVVCRIV
jgi:hypothetical protein